MKQRSIIIRALFLMSALCILLASGCTTKASKEPLVYKVGETGPAGGIVFYDKGERTDGWRYLEAAPARTEVFAAWPEALVPIDTETKVGSGRSNTELLVKADSAGSETAATACDTLAIKTYSDWFLPSKDELSLLFTNLARTGKDSFLKEGYAYWSSSSFDAERAWAQGFSNGVQGRVEKSELLVVRAIRAF